MSIRENFEKLRMEVPDHVTIVAAAKMRTAPEIAEVIDTGITDVGENYVQETERVYQELGERARQVRWHMIGHLQVNKINKALQIFDMIQTVDSYDRAQAINLRASRTGKVVSVLLEINVGGELSKSGLKPDEELVERLVREIAQMSHLRLEGIMTMGPLFEDPERLRPYYKRTREIYNHIKSLAIDGVHFNTLSMGMSDSYRVALEEGSTMIRVGTLLFGPRY